MPATDYSADQAPCKRFLGSRLAPPCGWMKSDSRLSRTGIMQRQKTPQTCLAPPTDALPNKRTLSYTKSR